jgi:uncharacterized membrane protein (UPF0127 family)
LRAARLATTALLLLAACSSSSGLVIHTSRGTVDVHVEIADDQQEQARGLMGRSSLGASDGMAFLWTSPVEETFWMKNTTIPLSIAFWDERDRIVRILDMAPCRAEPCPTYDAGMPFVGALEVNQGFFAAHGITVGDRVTLVRAAS